MVIVLVVVVFGVVLGSYFIFWVGCLEFGLCLGVWLGVFRCLGLMEWIWVGDGLVGFALVGLVCFCVFGVWF